MTISGGPEVERLSGKELGVPDRVADSVTFPLAAGGPLVETVSDVLHGDELLAFADQIHEVP